MMKWIRWWGIGAFILLIVLIFIFWFFTIDKIIENNIEDAGEYLTGAKVDIGNADLTIIPLGISLRNLQMANPNSPMQNMIDAEDIQFHLDGKYLFERKVIINDMVVNGLKFNTPREKSGKIRGGQTVSVKKVYEDFIAPLVDLSKIKTFVEQENLQTVDAFNDVLDDIKRVEGEWKVIYRNVPTMDDMREHRATANKITAEVRKNRITGLIKNVKNIKQLKDGVEDDINFIESNRKAMLIDIDSLEAKKNRAIRFAEQDIAHLRAKYTPDIQGLKNFSKYIFKDDILRQISEGMGWYGKLEPFFTYAYQKIKDDYFASKPIFYEGLDVKFPEQDPQPSFLIKLAQLSLEKSGAVFSGEINNFTTEQNITGQPTAINLSGENLDFAKSIKFSSLLNHVDSENIYDKFAFSIIRQKAKSNKYKIQENWELSLDNAYIDKIINVDIRNGKINGNLRFNFSNVAFDSEYLGDKNIIINSIESVLKTISNFYVDVKLNGLAGNYNTTIKSNLDNIVDNAVRKIAQDEVNKVMLEVNQIVEKKKQEALEIVEIELKKLTVKMTQIDELLVEAKDILKQIPRR